MREMDKVVDGEQIDHLQITNKKGEVLMSAPMHLNLGKIVPRVFRAPIKATGYGVSIIAKLLGVRVRAGSNPSDETEEN